MACTSYCVSTSETCATMQPSELPSRRAELTRNTTETRITCSIDLDGDGSTDVSTGIGFLDHMLTIFGKHSGMSITMHVEGDTWVDDHHSVEDAAIVLGSAVGEALGDKSYIARYGHAYVPMDDALCRSVIDLSGRFYLQFDGAFSRERVGDLSTEMVRHFWYSFAEHVRCNLHITLLAGDNDHHRAEAIFKATARALRAAVRRDLAGTRMPSTKGVL